ncbi:DUF4013 domain-containing protein [Halorutilales archaeon Cl-col2-1]
MIEDAVRYPMNSDEAAKNILIGGILTLIGVLILPIFVVSGYYVRVLRTTTQGDERPPSFGDWGDLLVEGLKATVIGIIYMIIPAVVFFVTVGGSMMAMMGGGRAGGALGAGMGAIGFLVSALLFLVFWYLLPAALTSFSKSGKIGSAFDVGTIKSVVSTGDYAMAWVFGLVMMLVGGFITGILGIIPLLGQIIGVFVTFYFAVVANRLYAQGYVDALEGTETRI